MDCTRLCKSLTLLGLAAGCYTRAKEGIGEFGMRGVHIGGGDGSGGTAAAAAAAAAGG